MSVQGESPQNLSGKLHVLAQAALQYVRARVDLLQRELQHERTRILGVVARAAIFAVGVVMTYQMIATFIIVAFWDTPWRLHAAGGLVLLTAGITFGAWRTMRAGSTQANPPFSVSIAEIDKDRAVLERIADMADTSRPRKDSSPDTGKAAARPTVTAPTPEAAAARRVTPGSIPPVAPPGGSLSRPQA